MVVMCLHTAVALAVTYLHKAVAMAVTCTHTAVTMAVMHFHTAVEMSVAMAVTRAHRTSLHASVALASENTGEPYG